MTLYNITKLTGSLNAGQLVLIANEYTSGVLFYFFSIALFFIMLLALKKYDFADNILVSSFLSFIISAIMLYGGFVNVLYPLTFLIMTAMSGFYVWMTKN